MTTDHTVILEDVVLDAANTLRANAELRRILDAQDAAAKAVIAERLFAGETGTNADGEPLVKIQPGARVWNEAEARKHLTPELLASITVTVTEERLDKTKAKDTLAPAIYAQCTKANADSVRVL